MKKILFWSLFMAVMLLTPLGIVAGNVCLPENFVKAEEVTVTPITSLSEITDMAGSYKLTADLTYNPDKTFSSIGTDEKPFTGAFDGGGNTITLDNFAFNQKNQGIFGVAENAEIRNVKIKCNNVCFYTADFMTGVPFDEANIGLVVGNGKNVTIEKCEVEGSILNYYNDPSLKLNIPLQLKFTMGGIIGKAENANISKCGVYLDAGLSYEQANVFTNKFGGIVGQVYNYTNINYCVAYTTLTLFNSSEKIAAENQIGGIAGGFGGKYSTMTNCVSDFRYNLDLLDGDIVKDGGIVGAITSTVPTNGNLKSCGFYAYDLANQKQISDFTGDKNTYVSTENDYLVSLADAGVLETQDFYEKQDVVKWDLNIWDFIADWIIADSKIKLQDFQYFSLNLSQTLDINGLLRYKEGSVTEYNDVRYGTDIEFQIEFINPEDDVYYYIYDVKKANGKNNEKITYSLEKIVVSETDSYYLLKLKASADTEGEYSFVTTAVQYNAYVIAGEGGKVKTEASSSLNDYLVKRTLSKDAQLPYNIQAKENYQHKFSSWTLWQQTTEELYTQNIDDTVNYMKYEQDGETTYWVKVHSSLVQSSLSIQLGSQTFKDNFIKTPNSILLQANFETSVYQINIGNFDVKTIKKVEVVYDMENTNRIKVFDGDTPVNDFLTIDRKENLILKVYVKRPYELLPEKFDQKLKVQLRAKNDIVVDDENVTLYELALNASALNELVNTESQYSLELFTQENKEDKGNGLPLWVIIAIAGGALVLVAVVIIIIVKVKRRGGGKKKESVDYDKYFN